MSMPLPPGFKIPEEPIKQANVRTPIKSVEYVPPAPSTGVDATDTMFILRKHLLPQHMADPNVLNYIKSYLQSRDNKQAAKASGLTSLEGANLRKRPDIHAAIAEITQVAIFRTGYDPSEIIHKVKELIDFDPIDLEHEDGGFKTSLKDVPDEARRALRALKVKNTYFLDANNMPVLMPNGRRMVETEIISYEFYDKIKSSELIGRENNLFKESKIVTHDISTNMSNTLLESKDRAEQRKLAMSGRDVSQTVAEVMRDDE